MRVTAEPVEGRALGPGLQEAVLVGLAVHGDQRLGDLGQRGHGHRGSADPGARAPLGRDVAGQHDLVVLDLAPGLLHGVAEAGQRPRRDDPLDPRLPGAGAHGAGVGAAAEQQPEGGDDHRLAGTGLTGDHGQPGAELERRGVDDAERADPQLLKHRLARWSPLSRRRARPRRASPRPGRPNLATSRSVNGAWCRRTSRTGRAPRRTSIRAPGGRSTVRRPSHHSTPAPRCWRAPRPRGPRSAPRPSAGRTGRGR